MLTQRWARHKTQPTSFGLVKPISRFCFIVFGRWLRKRLFFSTVSFVGQGEKTAAQGQKLGGWPAGPGPGAQPIPLLLIPRYFPLPPDTGRVASGNKRKKTPSSSQEEMETISMF